MFVKLVLEHVCMCAHTQIYAHTGILTHSQDRTKLEICLRTKSLTYHQYNMFHPGTYIHAYIHTYIHDDFDAISNAAYFAVYDFENYTKKCMCVFMCLMEYLRP